MKIKNLNKKGFTLIELLAVIVVLAVIMVLAVPNVIETMNTAKSKSFVMYGQKVIRDAMSKYETQYLLSTVTKSTYSSASGDLCYTFSDLGIASGGGFEGFVTFKIDSTTGKVAYKLYLADSGYYYDGVDSTLVLNGQAPTAGANKMSTMKTNSAKCKVW